MDKKTLLVICLIIVFTCLLSVKFQIVFFVETIILATILTLSILRLKHQYSNKQISLLSYRAGVAIYSIIVAVIVYLLFDRYFIE